MLRRLYNWLWELFWRFREWEDYCEYPYGRVIREGDEWKMKDNSWKRVDFLDCSRYWHIAKMDRGTIRCNYHPPKNSTAESEV
jgi:hypothetical protein